MPANSAGRSSERPVKGESEVEAWLQSVRSDWEALNQVRAANHESIEEALNLFIEYLKILSYCPGGPKFMNVKAPPTLLRDALFENQEKRKSFRKDIGDLHGKIPLARLLLLSCTEPEDVVSVKMTTDTERDRDLMDAWKQEYESGALDNFLKAMEWYESNYDPAIHSGRTIGILQSSGTGKSRLVDQLASVHPVFSVTFRASDRVTEDWPPRDPLVMEFFEYCSRTDPALPPEITEIRGEEMCAAFMGALVGALADEPDISLPIDVNSRFSYGLPDTPEAARRQAFLKVVCDNAKTMLHKRHAFLAEKRRWIQSLSPASTEGATDSKRKGYDKELSKSSSQWHAELFSEFCQPAFERLSAKLHAAGHTKFFLGLDECTILGGTAANEREPSRKCSLIAFQRVLKAAEHMTRPVSFWFLTLDRSPSAGMLVPSGPLVPSSRLTANLQPLPPFTYTGFNQLRHRLRTDKASASLDIENLRYLGRPLWSSMRAPLVVTFAKRKLLAARDLHPVDLSQVLAVFSSRACLKLAKNDAANRIAANAVRCHMRILVSVVKTTIVTTVPSEPILSIAAAVALTKSPQVYHDALNTLCKELERQDSVLAAGEEGELCCRLLLLLACDMTTIEQHGTFVREDTTSGKSYIYAVGLHDLLSTLLGKKQFGFEAKEEKELAEELRSRCEGKWLNFTHFIQYEKTIDELTLEELERAWFSGAAIQCCHNQPIINILLLYYDGPPNEPFDGERIGLFGIQVKARAQQADSTIGDGLTVPPILHPNHAGSESTRVKRPMVVMVMDLSTSVAFPENRRKKLLVKRAAERTKKWSGYIEEEPENILVNVRGCSALQYPVLHDFSEPFGRIFTIMTERQPPGILGELEERMALAMYPFERLTRVKEAERRTKQ